MFYLINCEYVTDLIKYVTYFCIFITIIAYDIAIKFVTCLKGGTNMK